MPAAVSVVESGPVGVAVAMDHAAGMGVKAVGAPGFRTVSSLVQVPGTRERGTGELLRGLSVRRSARSSAVASSIATWACCSRSLSPPAGCGGHRRLSSTWRPLGRREARVGAARSGDLGGCVGPMVAERDGALQGRWRSLPSPTRLGSAPRPRLGAAGYVNHPDPDKEGTTDERISCSRG
jgi:hypothetical protein